MSVRDRQLKILHHLLSKGSETRYGHKYDFSSISSYAEFEKRLPISFYRDIEGQIKEIKTGRESILWPGAVNRFAVSAGTTGKGKHLPLSAERLGSDQRFMRKLCISYFKQQPNIFRILGKHLSLPGSVEKHNGNLVGEISGFTALSAPWWIRILQAENPRKLTLLPFREKFEQVLNASIHANLKTIVAVPSWILTLFQQVLEKTGKRSIAEVWPDLKLMICGGVKLSNYRSYLEELAGDLKLDFIETYGSSEGYFAYTDDLKKDDLGLVCDNGIFFEFIPEPLHELESLSIQPAVPLWKVEPGVPYAIVVTTNAGLWRYAVNDIIEFTSVEPPRITVSGRLSEMLDEFGEGLYLYEAEKVLNKATKDLELEKGIFTVGGYIKSEKSPPRHYWFIQFFEPVHPDTLKKLARLIDSELCKINRHYAIRRESGALAPPVVSDITQADINNWLEFRGKEKAQGKLPRSLTERTDVEYFLRR